MRSTACTPSRHISLTALNCVQLFRRDIYLMFARVLSNLGSNLLVRDGRAIFSLADRLKRYKVWIGHPFPASIALAPLGNRKQVVTKPIDF